MARPKNFDKLVKHLVSKSKDIGEGTHNKKQRPWLDFQDLNGGAVGNFDVDGLYKKLDRTEANELYTVARTKPDALEHEVVVPKLAENFMAGVLRDHVDMRKRSRIRMMVHAGTRARVDGQDTKGPLTVHTIGFLSGIENAKKVGKPAPPE